VNKQNKINILYFLSLVLCTSNITYGIDYPPKFEGKFIKMVAAKNKCGIFTIKANDNVYLYAYVNKNGVSYWLKEFFKPMRVEYDWAGSGPNDHYVIGCRTSANHKEVSCKDYVTIDSLQHNLDCKSIRSDKPKYSLNYARKWKWELAAATISALLLGAAITAVAVMNERYVKKEEKKFREEPGSGIKIYRSSYESRRQAIPPFW